MDRHTRRMQRIRLRSRRTKLAAGIAIVAASVVVLAAAAFGQQGSGTPERPKPQVDVADLTPAQQPVDPGWEGQVGTDANLVGVQWSGDQGADFTVEVRRGSGEWRKAGEVGTNDAEPDPGSADAAAAAAHQGGTNASEPIWVGKDVSGVRVRLDDGTAQDVKLHVIDSFDGKKPEANVESTGTPTVPTTAAAAPAAPATTAPGAPGSPPPSAGGGPGAVTTTSPPSEQGFGLPQSLAAVALATVAVAFVVRRRRVLAVLVGTVVLVGTACAPAPGGGGGDAARPIPDAIVARSQWAPDLPWNWDACPGGPEYSYVGTAIVHHTVNSNDYGPGDSIGIMRGIWAYHVQSLGYCDIAYNFIIDNYGVPFEGRLGGIDQPVIGAHAIGANTGTTGIAMLGTFSGVTPSGGALGTLENLIRWKLFIHGANPFDDPAADILGHRDTSATECPGDALYNYLPYTRHYVKLYWPQ
ncbi:MAG TPA: N-acetylmuramoyl-L-alanine amidase [Acidimicrobiia bacterium]|nr:N-acetylmuramoyl-L-alanine amidase [Acidimicrobiia bacterium]